MPLRPKTVDTGDRPLCERGGVEERLECRARLPLALTARLNGLAAEIAAADEGEHVARLGIDGDERRLQAGLPKVGAVLR